MAVQQGQLSPTDTTKNMTGFYNDAVVTTVAGVNRAIHNGTQFARLVLQRDQPVTATAFTSSGSVNLDAQEYIDGSFVGFSTTGVSQVTVSFGTLISTSSIVVYSTTEIDTVTGNWTVQTSLNNTEVQFNSANFDANITSVTSAIIDKSLLAGATEDQIRYTLAVDTPPIDTTNAGLPYWRIKHATPDILDGLTEIQIIQPLTPTVTYFNTDGTPGVPFTFEKDSILDATYDNINGIFYTIRFNDQTTGTATITLGDGFSDGEAGTASGTTSFNPGRWTESSTNTAFLRTGDELSYNVSSGKGQLETTYTMGDFTATLLIDPDTITTEDMWVALRALDSDNKVLIQEGVGYETSPTPGGVFFASAVENFVNSTATCTLRDLRPLWHNSVSGTETFTVSFDGANWTVVGSTTGALNNAQTGVAYDESVDATTPIEFLVSCTASPTLGEQFTFDLNTNNDKKVALDPGTVTIDRASASVTTGHVFTTPITMNFDRVTFEIAGNTDGSVNISADNFTAIPASGASFPDVNVFTVERTDDEGKLTASPTVIESFDIIGDPSRTYNTYLDGRVQIATAQSGTGGGFIYIKVDDTLYKYPNDVQLSTETGGSATQTSTGQIARDGTHSFSWTHDSGVNGLPFLTYHEYDENIDVIHLKTIDKDTLLDNTDNKEIVLDQSGYSTTNNFKVFYDQNDFDTLYYVDGSTNLQAFNIDSRISAFMAVNAEDVSMPAGTANQTFVNADVINAWGEVLNGKVVTFQVTSGDGVTAPPSDTTVGDGRATVTFTVGSSVGVSVVTATVTET